MINCLMGLRGMFPRPIPRKGSGSRSTTLSFFVKQPNANLPNANWYIVITIANLTVTDLLRDAKF